MPWDDAAISFGGSCFGIALMLLLLLLSFAFAIMLLFGSFP